MGSVEDLHRWKQIRTWFLGTLLVGAGLGFVVFTAWSLCLCAPASDTAEVVAVDPVPVATPEAAEFEAAEACPSAANER